MSKTHHNCHCDHCQEIINQQDRLQDWQFNRNKYNKFIEKKALEVRPDLISYFSSQLIPVSFSTNILSLPSQSKESDTSHMIV